MFIDPDVRKIVTVCNLPFSSKQDYHLDHNYLFSKKRDYPSLAHVIIALFKDEISNGKNKLIVGLSGVDNLGIEIITDFFSTLVSDKNILAVLLTDHGTYHSLFYDESVVISPFGKRKDNFKIKNV